MFTQTFALSFKCFVFLTNFASSHQTLKFPLEMLHLLAKFCDLGKAVFLSNFAFALNTPEFPHETAFAQFCLKMLQWLIKFSFLAKHLCSPDQLCFYSQKFFISPRNFLHSLVKLLHSFTNILCFPDKTLHSTVIKKKKLKLKKL